MCAGIPYRAEFTYETDLVKNLIKWIKQVFTDERLYEYFLKMSASCLKGKNDDKIFPIWTGEGDNSKSMIVKLFEAALGPYCIKFPTSLLTGKRTGSSNAMPELARSKATRLAMLQEPDDEETIRGGILKELTGGDSFFVRNIHEKGGEVQAMFKMILMCNKVPAIPTGGKAVKNRTRIVPFMSTWVNSPPQSEEEQFAKRLFKKDPFFEVQIPRLAQAFMWLLIQYYPKYMREGIDEPPIVKEATSQYWEDNDVYRQFIGECIVAAKTDEDEIDENASLNKSEIYREFKAWYRDSFPGNKPPDSNTVYMELSNNSRLGRQGKNRRWYGIRLATRNTAENVLNI
jgi:phage/plasmid-associated DNA primase